MLQEESGSLADEGGSDTPQKHSDLKLNKCNNKPLAHFTEFRNLLMQRNSKCIHKNDTYSIIYKK